MCAHVEAGDLGAGAPVRLAVERVGTDQFGKGSGLVSPGLNPRSHLIKVHTQASFRGLPSGFTAGQSAADDGDFSHLGILPFGGKSKDEG